MELRLLRKKWERKDFQGRYIKPYFFGHIDKTKGFYNTERKNYMKHDTSMDYLREILEAYRVPYIKEEKVVPFMDIIGFKYDSNQAQRWQVNKILYQIDHFKRTSFYIWNGYAETDERFMLYSAEEDRMIDSINKYSVNNDSMYCLLKRLASENENGTTGLTLRILFNIGNEEAFGLVIKSKDPISTIEQCQDGDITLFSKTYKKMSK